MTAAVQVADTGRRVVVGVDTHRDFHHAVVVDERGGELGDRVFPANGAGYAGLVAWAGGFGRLVKAGVECTGSYGAGLTAYLLAIGDHTGDNTGDNIGDNTGDDTGDDTGDNIGDDTGDDSGDATGKDAGAVVGLEVVEVTSLDRQQRRLHGKTDHLDALHAARAAASGQAQVVPKVRDGHVEAIRVIHAERRLVVKQNTETMNVMKGILVSAPDQVRSRLADIHGAVAFAKACAHLRVRHDDDTVAQTTIGVLQRRAKTWLAGRATAKMLLDELHDLVTVVNPALLAVHGVGPDSAATLLSCVGQNPERIPTEEGFALLSGVAPIPASSGNTSRHRLNRGGDRQANAALHRIIIVRLKSDPETRAYRDKALSRGKTRRDTIRLLKRYLARRLYPILCNPTPTPLTTT